MPLMRRLDFSPLILSMLPYWPWYPPPGIRASCRTPGPIRSAGRLHPRARTAGAVAAQPEGCKRILSVTNAGSQHCFFVPRIRSGQSPVEMVRVVPHPLQRLLVTCELVLGRFMERLRQLGHSPIG